MTREQEEARLEQAMQRGDELLVNSLRDDERQRRRVIIRVVVIAAILLAGGIVMTHVSQRMRVQRQIADARRAQAAAVAAATQNNNNAAPLPPPSSLFLPAAATQPTKDWSAALASLSDDNWRRAFALGTELARMSPQQSWPILESNFSKIPNFEARQQILKAFTFTSASGELHPRLLDVMHLGMTDPEPQVRAWAAGYLRGIAFVDFAEDSAAYEAWRKQSAGRPAADVAAEGAAAWIARLKTAKAKQIEPQARFVRYVRNDLMRIPAARDAAVKAGALDLTTRWVREHGDKDSDILVAARDLLTALKPDEAFLKTVILPMLDATNPPDTRRVAIQVLGRPDNKWAVDPLLAVLRESVTAKDKSRSGLIWDVAGALAEIGDPRAIPDMIAAIAHDDTYDTVYGIGYFGLGKMTGVRYDESHNGAWWRQWWERERKRFPEPTRSSPIPKFDKTKAAQSDGGVRPPIYAMMLAAADAAEMPVDDVRVKNDENMRYFLMGPKIKTAPKDGYRLLLVLPGGDGGEDFRPFIESVAQESVSDHYLLAQLVAPKWYEGEDGIVWPTAKSREKKMKFTTEQFIDAVVADVAAAHKLDAKHIYALGWSSGGPAVYAAAMRPKTPITGAFVAMSVFKPAELPPAGGARGRAFYILHSPQDFIRMTFPENARKQLAAAGAKAKLQTYQGGHGWHGDPHKMIRTGVTWLESQSNLPATRATTAPATNRGLGISPERFRQ